MKKLTKEEVEQLGVKPNGRVSVVRAAISNMAIDEYLLLEHKEWKNQNRAPSVVLRKVEKEQKKKFTCHKAMTGAGWIVHRNE